MPTYNVTGKCLKKKNINVRNLFELVNAAVAVIKEYKSSWYTFYLLVNTILRTTLHLQMLYRQLEDQQVAPPIVFISGSKSPLTRAFVLLAPFLDQINSIVSPK